MKRIIVIGCPGSGKSRFSRKLADITGLPLIHLDNLYWRSDRTHLDHDEFMSELQKVTSGEAWIIDGNYQSSLEYRMRKCDGIIFMDFPTDICLQGLRERAGKARSDIPWQDDGDDEDFIQYVSSFSKENRPVILELLDRYSRKQIIELHSRREADDLLDYWERTYRRQ